MKSLFAFCIACLLVIPIIASAQVSKGNLNDAENHGGHAITDNQIQLINKDYPSLNFEYSFDKSDWHSYNLAKYEYMLVNFSVNENYCYVRICSDRTDSNVPNCKPFRLTRASRYKFEFDSAQHAYLIKLLQ